MQYGHRKLHRSVTEMRRSRSARPSRSRRAGSPSNDAATASGRLVTGAVGRGSVRVAGSMLTRVLAAGGTAAARPCPRATASFRVVRHRQVPPAARAVPPVHYLRRDRTTTIPCVRHRKQPATHAPRDRRTMATTQKRAFRLPWGAERGPGDGDPTGSDAPEDATAQSDGAV